MFLISDFFQPFCIFPHENNTKQDYFNTARKVRDRATIIVSWKIWSKKGSVYLERDNDTDRLQKSVYIITFVFTGTYTGPFCHNPVESSRIDAFLQESVGHEKVQDSQDNLWTPDLTSEQILFFLWITLCLPATTSLFTSVWRFSS